MGIVLVVIVENIISLYLFSPVATHFVQKYLNCKTGCETRGSTYTSQTDAVLADDGRTLFKKNSQEVRRETEATPVRRPSLSPAASSEGRKQGPDDQLTCTTHRGGRSASTAACRR